MPIAEILAGISLVKASVDFIKSNLDTCKDIGEIGSAIDGLLRGKDEVDKKSNQRSLGFKEQFDTAHIAREAIDQRLAAEQLQEISQMINLRFGPDTWREIMEERARRIQEHKEHVRQVAKQKAKEHKELMDQLKMIGIVTFSILVLIALFVGTIWYSRLPV
jgi:urocanate hydratase